MTLSYVAKVCDTSKRNYICLSPRQLQKGDVVLSRGFTGEFVSWGVVVHCNHISQCDHSKSTATIEGILEPTFPDELYATIYGTVRFYRLTVPLPGVEATYWLHNDPDSIFFAKRSQALEKLRILHTERFFDRAERC